MKRIIIIAIIIIFIAILGLAGYYIYNIYVIKPLADTNFNSDNTQTLINVSVNNNTNSNSNINQPEVNISADNKSKIKFLAIVFGQNFGSYSNQTALTNFDEIYSFMGPTIKNWVASTYKAEIISQHPRDVYYAIQTKVLNVRVTEMDETKETAIALLNTQRQEFKETPDNVSVFNQDLILNLIKVNDNWIVDSAYWQ